MRTADSRTRTIDSLNQTLLFRKPFQNFKNYDFLYFNMILLIDWAEDAIKFLAIHCSIIKPQVSFQTLDFLHVILVEDKAKEVQVLPYPFPIG